MNNEPITLARTSDQSICLSITMRTLLASLTDHPMAILRAIADLRGIELTTNARDDAAAQLAATLAQAGATDAALASCSAEAQAAWAALLAAGGRMKARVFSRHHGTIRPIGPGRLEREQAWRQPQSPAEELWYRGLLFRGFADLGDGPAEYFYIPEELWPPSASGQAPLPTRALPSLTPTQAPAVSRPSFNLLAVDLCHLLALLRSTPVHVDRAGRLRPADLERLRTSLLVPDPVRCDLLLTLACERGWLTVTANRLAVNPEPAMAWLQDTPWAQMTALFEAWRQSTDLAPLAKPVPTPAGEARGWNDLRHVPTLQAEGTWHNDPVLAREAILESLRRLDPDAWYALDDLVAWFKAVNPDFQRPDGNYAGWYLRDVATGRYLSGFEAWEEVEGRLIRFVVSGPLFWLGAVALGLEEGGDPVSFRLTPAGVAWLSGTTPAEIPRPARLAVAEDFTVSAGLTVPLLDRFRLLRFSELLAEPYEWGGPTRHRITRRSLARARAEGIGAQAILRFLRRATGGRLPARVATALSRWDQQGGTVRITRGAVLRVEDASTLAALRADPAIAPLLGELISAQAVVVSQAKLPQLLKALTATGYTVTED